VLGEELDFSDFDGLGNPSVRKLCAFCKRACGLEGGWRRLRVWPILSVDTKKKELVGNFKVVPNRHGVS